MSEILLIIVGGVFGIIGILIGIIGTLMGVILTHYLENQRDRVKRESDEKKETIHKLLYGAIPIAENHGRAQIPFDGGNSLYFPENNLPYKENIDNILSEINQINNKEIISIINRALQIFLRNLRDYLHTNPKK